MLDHRENYAVCDRSDKEGLAAIGMIVLSDTHSVYDGRTVSHEAVRCLRHELIGVRTKHSRFAPVGVQMGSVAACQRGARQCHPLSVILFHCSELFNCTALVDLNLYSNGIVSVPGEITQLTHVRCLNLASNKLTQLPRCACVTSSPHVTGSRSEFGRTGRLFPRPPVHRCDRRCHFLPQTIRGRVRHIRQHHSSFLLCDGTGHC